MVRSRGLEPPHLSVLAPQASASTNSATTAWGEKDEKVWKPRVPMMADHVTNRMLRDKACHPSGRIPNFGAASGPCGGPLNVCRVAAKAIRRVDGDAVAVHDHPALGHRRVIRKDDHGILFVGVQLNDRAAAEPQHLMDGHGCGAKHHSDVTATLSSVATCVPYCTSGATASRHQVTMLW